ncbi:lantibiotic protection ABC transporter permease subunit, MutE/EpiE family [Dermatophilus congolensis]|uniref:Lantibiotic protection ABC transporter permease subunit, MutE/EpiE family n=1 Tax=Dermatophilus congolensis TaxID=1863 RepID=A0A239VCF3_9MICO|nr:hypothetical protein [Dermatophilus congolensis]SNV19881.1 lantibiotic protection ABC transporter permease subunit, MutE/EpiE family [Dermatophilus congolensis]
MSIANTAATPTQHITFQQAIRAELTRTKSSASSRFALAGAAIAVLQAMGWRFVATRAIPDWNGLFGWQTMYATALLAPIVALLAAVTVSREKRAREGGTWMRPLSAPMATFCRGLVLAWQSLLFHAPLTLPLLLIGWAGGLSDPPITRMLSLWLVFWATSLLPLMVGFAMSRVVGMLPTISLMMVWQVVGTLKSETATWWAQPWTWGVHAAQPLLGVHANGIALETNSPIWEWNPWLSAIASAVVAAAALFFSALRAHSWVQQRPGLSARLPRKSSQLHSVHAAVPAAHTPVQRGPDVISKAHHIVWRGTGIAPLTGMTLLVIAAAGWIWSPGFVIGLATWLVVPFGCCICACLIETAEAPGRRIAMLRADLAHQGQVMARMALLLIGLIVAWVAVIVIATGGSAIAAIRVAVLIYAVGAAVFFVSSWLATRFSAAAAIGVLLVVAVISLVFGGSGIAQTPLWVIGVLGWPVTATSALPVAATLAASALLSGVAYRAWLAALRRSIR